jgi:hypothetical protein
MVLQFSLGNKDFSSIFGKQEAEERRQREVEMEFKSRHSVPKKEDAKEDTSPRDEIDKSDGAEKNTTKKVGKYVPPPTMGTKKKETGKNISPLLDGNYE